MTLLQLIDTHTLQPSLIRPTVYCLVGGATPPAAGTGFDWASAEPHAAYSRVARASELSARDIAPYQQALRTEGLALAVILGDATAETNSALLERPVPDVALYRQDQSPETVAAMLSWPDYEVLEQWEAICADELRPYHLTTPLADDWITAYGQALRQWLERQNTRSWWLPEAPLSELDFLGIDADCLAQGRPLRQFLRDFPFAWLDWNRQADGRWLPTPGGALLEMPPLVLRDGRPFTSRAWLAACAYTKPPITLDLAPRIADYLAHADRGEFPPHRYDCPETGISVHYVVDRDRRQLHLQVIATADHWAEGERLPLRFAGRHHPRQTPYELIFSAHEQQLIAYWYGDWAEAGWHAD